MRHTIDDEPPIKTGVSTQAYKDGWERTFGEKEPEPTCEYPTKADTTLIFMPSHVDNTGAFCRNRGQTERAALADHDACYTCNEFAEIPEPEPAPEPVRNTFPETCLTCGTNLDDISINWCAPYEPYCVVCAQNNIDHNDR